MCIDKKINPIACLKHFLVGPKKIKYLYEVIDIVRCKTEFEYQNSLTKFASKFSDICNHYPAQKVLIKKH